MPYSSKSDALRRMASGIAHELNNICTAVIGNLQIIEHRELPRQMVLEILADVLRSTEQGLTLARRLQAYSGHQMLTPESFDLRALVEEIADQRMLTGLTVIRDLPAAPVTVCLDRKRMRELLLELALNARTATPDRGMITLGLRTQETEFPAGFGAGVLIYVKDNGHGMTMQEMQCAFDPMFTTKPLARASNGWGLSLVSGLVRQMGGRIALATETGGGTNVTVLLPVPMADPARVAYS